MSGVSLGMFKMNKDEWKCWLLGWEYADGNSKPGRKSNLFCAKLCKAEGISSWGREPRVQAILFNFLRVELRSILLWTWRFFFSCSSCSEKTVYESRQLSCYCHIIPWLPVLHELFWSLRKRPCGRTDCTWSEGLTELSEGWRRGSRVVIWRTPRTTWGTGPLGELLPGTGGD